MKTAIIYSGQTRTFTDVFQNQFFHVLRKFPNPEFYVSVEDDKQAQDMTRLWERFPAERVHIEYVQQPQIPEPSPDPKWLAMYPASSPPQSILRQLWALNRAWDFFAEHSTSQAQVFDIVVRIRPDIAFARFEVPQFGPWWTPEACLTPWWARWGGVNDRMAVMGSKAAYHYFRTFDRLKALMDLGCPLHPETLVAASLELGEIEVQPTLATEFVTCRLDGSTVAASINAIDFAEYARWSR